MRAAGINWGAVLAAAVAIWAIGFVIYASGLVIQADQWMAMSGISEAEMEAVGQSRMPFFVVMPLMTAVFLGVLFKWGNISGLSKGAQWGAVVALASAIPTLLYGWVYGVGPIEMTIIDAVHLFLGHVAAGAVLGAWK